MTSSLQIQATIESFGIKSWSAICTCKTHASKGMVRVSTQNLAKVAFLTQADPFTESGAKKINHDIMNRVA